MIVRSGAVALLVLAAAFFSIRSAVGLAPSNHPLQMLRPWFSQYPAMIEDRAMAAVGLAARKGAAPPQSALRDLATLARKEPLRVEPYLVAGATAQLQGDTVRSERLFLAARQRDPRSIAARYFLAERLLVTDRVEQGLVEMATLARLDHRMAQPLVPAFAEYARSPGAVERLKRFFVASPEMRDPVLLAMARDPANAPLVLRLAPSLPVAAGPPYPEWQSAVVAALAGVGRMDEAVRVWSLMSGVRTKPIVVDPQFADQAPPPFAWSILSGSAGVAEVGEGGGLDVIYYGREPSDFARQMLALAPGQYRIASRLSGSIGAPGLQWRVGCPDGTQAVVAPVGTSADFVIKQGCPSQLLTLIGSPSEPAQTIEARVTSVTIERIAQ